LNAAPTNDNAVSEIGLSPQLKILFYVALDLGGSAGVVVGNGLLSTVKEKARAEEHFKKTLRCAIPILYAGFSFRRFGRRGCVGSTEYTAVGKAENGTSGLKAGTEKRNI
jgi:hypothetical protein